jgi:hypothetical protein
MSCAPATDERGDNCRRRWQITCRRSVCHVCQPVNKLQRSRLHLRVFVPNRVARAYKELRMALRLDVLEQCLSAAEDLLALPASAAWEPQLAAAGRCSPVQLTVQFQQVFTGSISSCTTSRWRRWWCWCLQVAAATLNRRHPLVHLGTTRVRHAVAGTGLCACTGLLLWLAPTTVR